MTRFASTSERTNENINYYIYSSGNRTHNLSRLQTHACSPAPRPALNHTNTINYINIINFTLILGIQMSTLINNKNNIQFHRVVTHLKLAVALRRFDFRIVHTSHYCLLNCTIRKCSGNQLYDGHESQLVNGTVNK